MRTWLLTIAICLLWAAPGMSADFRTIAVVSIDALHPKALTQKTAPLTMAMLDKGSLTRKGRSTTPPKTLIAHSAMITGRGPQQDGMDSNTWNPGDPRVHHTTIFHDAKSHGYRTGFFYSKPKLGYLENDAIDMAVFSKENAIDKGVQFLDEEAFNFVFIHVSGLDIVGPEYGWLSKQYLEELSYIDQYLEPLYEKLRKTGEFLLIITSDHAGFGRSHGGPHPDEAKLPFGVVSDMCSFPEVRKQPYRVTDLPMFLEQAMDCKVEEEAGFGQATD